jgi:hypothetical protein
VHRQIKASNNNEDNALKANAEPHSLQPSAKQCTLQTAAAQALKSASLHIP